MHRLLLLTALCACASVSAQTTIDITVPGNATCSYVTGPVTSGATAGHLQATATSSSGTGCATGGGTGAPVSFGPATPLAPATASLGNAGGPSTFTFTAVNASQCSGSITGSGASFTSTFCSTLAGCQGQQTVTATFPQNTSTTNDANYTVSVSCTGPGSPNPVASPVTPVVTVLHTAVVTGGTCPVITGAGGIASFSQDVRTNESVSYYSSGTRTVNMTQYDSIFGQIPSAQTWPGNSGITAVVTLATSNYVSAAFTVPANYMTGAPSNRYGQYYLNPSSYSKAPVSMTISTTCGDFSNPSASGSTVVPGCYKNKAGADTSIVVWENPAHTSPTCALQDGQTYYLNFINADITNVTPGGHGTATTTKGAAGSTCTSACMDPIANYIFN
jgi:hypothetical protein